MTKRSLRLGELMRYLTVANRQAANDWNRENGMSGSQGFTLGWIEANQNQSDGRGVIAREISDFFGTKPASVTSLLQGLESRGLIVRKESPDDARQKLVYATETGINLHRKFEKEMEAEADRLFSVLSQAEQEQLLDMLERVAANATVTEGSERQRTIGHRGPPATMPAL